MTTDLKTVERVNDVIITSDVFLFGFFWLLLKDSQQWLGRLIPDKQSLNDQLKQVQQNSLHREYCTY